MREEAHNYLTLALIYREAGLYEDGLGHFGGLPPESPLVSYYKGSLLRKLGRLEEGAAAFQEGEGRCPDYCFPNRLEELGFYRSGGSAAPGAMAHYYLAACSTTRSATRRPPPTGRPR